MKATNTASTPATIPQRRLANSRPTASVPATVAWSLGNEKSGGLVDKHVDVGHRFVRPGPIDRATDDLPDAEGDEYGECASDHDGTSVRGLYDDARRAEWAEFTAESAKCLAELGKEIRTEKFTLAELDEEEQNVDRLRRWHRELRARDLFDSIDPDEVQGRLDACAARLEQFTALVDTAVGLD